MCNDNPIQLSILFDGFPNLNGLGYFLFCLQISYIYMYGRSEKLTKIALGFLFVSVFGRVLFERFQDNTCGFVLTIPGS